MRSRNRRGSWRGPLSARETGLKGRARAPNEEKIGLGRTECPSLTGQRSRKYGTHLSKLAAALDTR